MSLSPPTALEHRAVLTALVRRVGKLTAMAAFLDRIGWTEEAAETRAVIARLRRVIASMRGETKPRLETPPVLH